MEIRLVHNFLWTHYCVDKRQTWSQLSVFRYTRQIVKIIRAACCCRRLHDLKYDSNIPPFGRCKFKYLNSVTKFRRLGEHDLEEVTQTHLRSGANFKMYFYKIRTEFVSPYISVSVSTVGESRSSKA